MTNDRVLIEQLKAIEERQKSRKEINDDYLASSSRKTLLKRVVISLAIMSILIACAVVFACFFGTKALPFCLAFLAIFGITFILFVWKSVKSTFIRYKQDDADIINDSIADIDKAIEISNDAIRTKSNFLSGISHDIRTPINAILGLNEMVIRESREPAIRDYAKDIKSAGNTLMAFVSDVLDTSQIEEGRLEIVNIKYDISSVVNDVMNMNLRAADEKGLTLSLKIDEQIPHLIKGDEIRVKQCILKLMSNAIKFTEEGSITLEIGFAKLNNNEILLTVSVSDTGIGIREEDIERLFSPFEKVSADRSVKNEGSGLGMSITRRLLEMMGSELRVESRYGSGSTFKFSVKQEVLDWQPVGNIEDSYERMRESQERYEESFHAPDAKVLVVDDSPVNLMIVEGLLKDTKMQFTMVDSGKKAIEESEKTRFDLILLDHMMPEMDGIETLHHLREDEKSLNKESPIVALTANAVEGAKEKYEKEGFDHYLSKPIVADKLEDAIRSYLDPKLIIVGNFEKKKYEEDITPATGNGSLTAKGNAFIDKLSNIKGLFTDKGIEYSGSEQLYEKVITEFAETGTSRASVIEEYYEQQDIKNYTIQVHALKSAARIIGATAISQLAAALEEAGNNEDLVKIQNATGELLKRYRDLVAQLEPLLSDGDDKPLIDDASLKEAIATIKELVEAFDFDSVDSVMAELKKYKMPNSFKENYSKLKTLVAEVARDDILLLLKSA